MKNFLIAYFSRKGNNYVDGDIVNLPVGNTETAATKIQSFVGGDLFEIQTTHSYSDDYHICTEEAKKELNRNARPELADNLPNPDDYDSIFLGFPNWWGTMPMAVLTFLESHDLKGKNIMPFCTHEGSRMGASERDLRKFCPDAIVAEGLAIQGSNVGHSDKEIEKWLQKIGARK